MGIVTDIRNKIEEIREDERFDKIDLCNWLQKYINEYADSLNKKVKKYQNNNKEKVIQTSRKASAKWKKENPEAYREQQREYKRSVRGYYEKHSKEILSKAENSLKDNRNPEIIEVGGLDEESK